MKSSNFNLRGIPEDVMLALKRKAHDKHISVNMLILNLVSECIGYSLQIKRPTYHDLDCLSGTWSEERCKEFEKHTQIFEEIDEELWS